MFSVEKVDFQIHNDQLIKAKEMKNILNTVQIGNLAGAFLNKGFNQGINLFIVMEN